MGRSGMAVVAWLVAARAAIAAAIAANGGTDWDQQLKDGSASGKAAGIGVAIDIAAVVVTLRGAAGAGDREAQRQGVLQ